MTRTFQSLLVYLLAVGCMAALATASLADSSAVEAPRPLGVPAENAAASDDPVEAPIPVRVHVDPAAIPELVEGLDSPDYRTRRRSSRLLEHSGPYGVEALTKAAHGGSLEVIARAVRILQTMYITGSDETVDAVDRALEDLKESGPPTAAQQAAAVLDQSGELREQRAVARIKRLGGVVKYGDLMADLRNPGVARQQMLVLLGENWRGGEADLEYLKRLQTLVTLYAIDGTPGDISLEAEAGLARALPHLKVQRRSRACLGVGGSSEPFAGCIISNVNEDSAAHRAGLMPGDLITEFGGKPVERFEDLVKLIYDYRPGDRVKVAIQRGGRDLELEVVLDGWDAALEAPRRHP
ncbi:MAG: PDZ domain-containing protein [Planctomycetes bacterium]|nr:PDZ domain-containing protein [Planctomycetota bacterium]